MYYVVESMGASLAPNIHGLLVIRAKSREYADRATVLGWDKSRNAERVEM